MGKLINVESFLTTLVGGIFLSLVGWTIFMIIGECLSSIEPLLFQKNFVYPQFEEHGQVIINPKTGYDEWKWNEKN